MKDIYKILKYPLTTEKAVRSVEAENTLIFAVSKSSNKKEIKWAIEKEYKVKVKGVKRLKYLEVFYNPVSEKVTSDFEWIETDEEFFRVKDSTE